MSKEHDLHLDLINALSEFRDNKTENDSIICFQYNSDNGFFSAHVLGELSGISSVICRDVEEHDEKSKGAFEEYQNLIVSLAMVISRSNPKLRDFMIDELINIEIEEEDSFRNN